MDIGYETIHTKRPRNKGGSLAEKGFAFQHHVAVSLLLDMLSDSDISHVYIETHDDIVLVYNQAGVESVELIQVKAEEPNQLWTTALITARISKQSKPVPGTSILEISLAGDAVQQGACFRIVTTYDVSSELDFLKTSLDSVERVSPSKAFDEFVNQAATKLGDIKSPKNNGCEYWAQKTKWDYRGSLKAVETDNILRLDKLLNQMGENLLHDQKCSLYEALIYTVQEAAIADFEISPKLKCIERHSFEGLIKNRISNMDPAPATGSSLLEEKMRAALISTDQIDSAVRTRMAYRSQTLKKSYLNFSNWELAQAEIEARLHSLRSQMYVHKLEEGEIFLDLCLQEIREVKNTIADNIPISMLYGYMYERTNRCYHRFSRPPR